MAQCPDGVAQPLLNPILLRTFSRAESDRGLLRIGLPCEVGIALHHAIATRRMPLHPETHA
jgi:hypothetical protein